MKKRQRTEERTIASEALARLPYLMGIQQTYEPRHATAGFGYIAHRLLRWATLTGDPK